jgi:hypothetical protein
MELDLNVRSVAVLLVSLAGVGFGPNPRYSHVRMPSKPTSFPDSHQPDETEPAVTEHSRCIFRIGRERYAFDFTSTVTRLRPEPAPVISIEEKREPGGRKPRPSTDAG